MDLRVMEKSLAIPMGLLRRELNESISRRERKNQEINRLLSSCYFSLKANVHAELLKIVLYSSYNSSSTMSRSVEQGEYKSCRQKMYCA